ncbi:MAG: SCO family protein [Bacteroidia bacterium]|nr:SCO family protein [Bacteroidia bacterium]
MIWYFYTANQDVPLRHLPYYGPKFVDAKNDSTYHEIKSFRFVNQYNEIITLDSLNHKIVVTEFFFTTCQSICPIMNSNLQKVYKTFADRKDVLILSHTVDPEQDSVPVLKVYAGLQGVRDRRWQFVTGPKKELYEAARKSYLLNAEEGDGGDEDFIHTQNFALIDKNKHIRGYYDGTDSVEINRLITDLRLLIQEDEFNEISKH